jgi:HK97 family phage portal protein
MNFIQKVVGKLANKALSYANTISLTEQNRETIWREFGGLMPLNWGNRADLMIREGYSENVDVYAIVKKIVDVSKSIPWIVERKKVDGTWEKIYNTSLHELMDEPNNYKGYTWNDIEEQTLLYLLVTGNVYLVGNTQFNSRLIQELDILPSSAINIYNRNLNFFMPQLEYQFNFGGTSRVYTQNELKHIKFYNPNLQTFDYGLSPVQVAAYVVKVGNERWIADASILSNKGVAGLISDSSQLPMTPDEATRVDAELRNRVGGAHNFGKIITTNKDLKYIQIGMSPSDMQLLEKGIVNTRALCNVFGIDAKLFNDTAASTFNNSLEAQKAMYTNCIIPLSDKMAEAYTQYLCTNHFPSQQVRMRQDFSGVECLQENKMQLADFKMKGIFTANEVRVAMGKAPITDDPNADKLIISTTLQSTIGNEQNQSTTGSN